VVVDDEVDVLEVERCVVEDDADGFASRPCSCG
jgi:hypothetical protein